MLISDFFAKLGISIRHERYCPGGVMTNGRVVLKVWSDGKIKVGGNWFYQISCGVLTGSDTERKVTEERVRLTDLIQSGSKSAMVMCFPEKDDSTLRKVRRFNSKEIFIGGEVLEVNGRHFLAAVERRSFSQFIEENTKGHNDLALLKLRDLLLADG